MIAIAFLFIHVLCDRFKSRQRLEAEVLVLRHQLNVLRRRAPRRLHLGWADRALFVWLYRRFSSHARCHNDRQAREGRKNGSGRTKELTGE